MSQHGECAVLMHAEFHHGSVFQCHHSQQQQQQHTQLHSASFMLHTLLTLHTRHIQRVLDSGGCGGGSECGCGVVENREVVGCLLVASRAHLRIHDLDSQVEMIFRSLDASRSPPECCILTPCQSTCLLFVLPMVMCFECFAGASPSHPYS